MTIKIHQGRIRLPRLPSIGAFVRTDATSSRLGAATRMGKHRLLQSHYQAVAKYNSPIDSDGWRWFPNLNFHGKKRGKKNTVLNGGMILEALSERRMIRQVSNQTVLVAMVLLIVGYFQHTTFCTDLQRYLKT